MQPNPRCCLALAPRPPLCRPHFLETAGLQRPGAPPGHPTVLEWRFTACRLDSSRAPWLPRASAESPAAISHQRGDSCRPQRPAKAGANFPLDWETGPASTGEPAPAKKPDTQGQRKENAMRPWDHRVAGNRLLVDPAAGSRGRPRCMLVGCPFGSPTKSNNKQQLLADFRGNSWQRFPTRGETAAGRRGQRKQRPISYWTGRPASARAQKAAARRRHWQPKDEKAMRQWDL